MMKPFLFTIGLSMLVLSSWAQQLGEVQVVQRDSQVFLQQEQSQEIRLSPELLTQQTDREMVFVLRDTITTPVSIEVIDQQLLQLDTQIQQLMAQRQQYAVIRKQIVELKTNDE